MTPVLVVRCTCLRDRLQDERAKAILEHTAEGYEELAGRAPNMRRGIMIRPTTANLAERRTEAKQEWPPSHPPVAFGPGLKGLSRRGGRPA